jgi:hypothetical protein
VIDNPIYQTKKEIYEKFRGQYFIVINMKRSAPGEPYSWLGGFIKYYSKNYAKMSDLMMDVENIAEFGDSVLSYGGDATGTLGAMIV